MTQRERVSYPLGGPQVEAHIEITEEPIALGRRAVRFAWKGPKGAEIRVGADDILRLRLAPRWNGLHKLPERLDWPLPWPMKKTRDAGFCEGDAAYYVRTDGANALSYLYHWGLARARRLPAWFVPRFVMTAHIWGLAYVPQSEMPSWRHFGRRRPRKGA